MTGLLRNQLVLAPENIGKIQRTGNKCYLQIELIPNIKISMIKNLLGSRDSFSSHCRVQSKLVWSRLSRMWYGYHQRENIGSRLFTEVKPCWTGLISGWMTKSTASDIEISSLLNRNPLKHSKKFKDFFAICLNLLIYYAY